MSDFLTNQIKLAVKAADKLLNDNNILKAPVDINRIAKKLGIKIVKLKFANDKISGLLKLKSKSGKPVIAVNEGHHINRQRFTIAHEIGHYLLHNINDLHVDSGAVYFRDEKSAQATNIKEIQANQFASELLMPRNIIIHDLKKVIEKNNNNIEDSLLELSEAYGVSQQAMLIKIGSVIS